MRLTICLLAAALAAKAQPSISPGGVVNAASYTAPVAPGSLASVFGTFEVNSPSAASVLPLPTILSQLSLQFTGGYYAPLFFASNTQTNIQIPWELTGQTQTSLIPISSGQTGSPQMLSLAAFAPGIFSINSQGTGQGAIQDTIYDIVDTADPAIPGITTIVIYCTGLGPVTNQPATGSPAPSNPLAVTTTLPDVTIGGIPAHVVFSGLAPGFVGVYQINARVPGSAPVGSAVPVVISMNGALSNAVTIAIQATGSDSAADAILSQMTQDEKLQMVHGGISGVGAPAPHGGAGWVPGIPSLGIPDLYLADGSVGVGNSVGPATALPSSIASAASWDLDEAYKYGSVIGVELQNYGMNINLGGNINLIGREPRDGRAFETKGEDPILAGKIAAAHIRAIQDQHVVGGIKHFALNDQETGRTTANAEIDERSMRESDLLAFEIGIKDSDVQSVMCAYNLVNGIYSCENPDLLTTALKGDWGFPGFVMSDWDATHSTVAAGLDQEQPDSTYFGDLGAAIQSNQVPQSTLDEMVHRILRALFEVGAFEEPTTSPVNTAADRAIAQEMEEQGAVLLQNNNGQLPLNASTIKSIAVIGSNADIGVLSGGGSAQVTPTGGPVLQQPDPCPPCWAPVIWDPSSPMDAIQAMAPGALVQFDPGTDSTSAAALAASSQVAIVFVSEWSSEGMDRTDLDFDGQDTLVSAVAAANPHTIVVMENAGAQVMPWLSSVSAVLEVWFPGQNGGPAIANLLFGAVNPSGKLPITFPASVNDLPHPVIATPPDGTTPFPVNYSEGLYVGYKWYQSQNITPLFPFGFGLSYTTFAFSNISLINNLTATNPNIQISFNLANTGSAAGAEVAQVYLQMPAGMGEPPLRLVGWHKVFLDAGVQQQVTIEIDENDSSHPLSWWNPAASNWQVAPGSYTFFVGNSSSAADLTLAGTVQIN
ncbi:glycoside hydrolase family 3 C-terminal domain-containing protein [Nevskia soli]|uniref:glycoside hydrolase family 3 C-terminal domain-containing protein n=1 Tax=Nevskia soli TaxID=418856 RepID=UPI0015D6DA00|nr:glycoside hydrolase family 3 C-terminal domain-containing protein [Nevskia soli]